jgi:ATP-dependent protease ClpP protease subunit
MTTNDITYLSFSGRINQASMDTLVGTCTDLANHGTETVYLMLSTPGGSVDSAIAAYNLLRGMPFRLITHNVGSVDSMGNVLFLAGEERYACSNSSFMFHGVGFNVSLKMRFDLRTLREKMDSVEGDQRKIAAIIADRTQLKPAEIDELFQEAVNRDPEYGVRHGIVHEIRELKIPAGKPIRHLELK